MLNNLWFEFNSAELSINKTTQGIYDQVLNVELINEELQELALSQI